MDRGEHMSIPSPNYTQVPNALFKLMPDMEKSELKVVLAVCRQTIGWHKTKDRLTVTLLMTLTGLSRQAVYDGIEEAKKRGILIQEETKQDGFIYSLDIQDPVSNEETLSVKPLDTQKKEKESTNNNNPLQDSWHKELEQLTGGYMGGGDAFRDLTDAWQRFPDVRRHTEAIRQTTAARSRTVVVYLKAFLTFNPDYVPPTYQKQSTYQRPKPGIGRASPPRAEAGPITPDEKEAKLREWVAARTKAGMDVPEKLRYLQVAA
jgi:phage replication O-like protein O